MALALLALASVACDGATAADGPPDSDNGTLIVSVVAGGQFSCALDKMGSAWCWGANDHGQLGRGAVSEMGGVDRVAGGLEFDMLAAGDTNVCGLAGHEVWCWGEGGIRRQGDPLVTPTRVDMTGLELVSVSVGGGFACGLTAAGEAWCWGRNDVLGGGQLGNGTIASSAQATRVLGDHVFDEVSAGLAHACGVAAGEVWCWGAGLFEALGSEGVQATVSPVRASLEVPASTITAGAALSCAGAGGTIYCWGINLTGQLGRGVSSTEEASPAAVETQTSLSNLSAGGVNNLASHVCGIAGDGRALCWGGNQEGQLGRVSSDSCQLTTQNVACALTPGAVDTEMRFDEVAAGEDHTCGLVKGVVWCWGGNDKGQIGTTGASGATPVRVEIRSS